MRLLEDCVKDSTGSMLEEKQHLEKQGTKVGSVWAQVRACLLIKALGMLYGELKEKYD